MIEQHRSTPEQAAADTRTTIADDISALIDPYTSVEPYTADDGTKRTHRVRHESLLSQLNSALEPGGTGDDGRRIFTSKPSARIDAIDRLTAIENACQTWHHNTGLYRANQPLATNLRKLVGYDWPAQDLRDLAKAAARWLTWARIVTGWETPPFRPHARCPHCEQLGGLRIRFDQRAAACIECGATWDATTIGILGESIRIQNGETADQDTRRGVLA